MGNYLEKALRLLNWVFNTFGTREICLLHVHRPSRLTPALFKFSLLPFVLVCILYSNLEMFVEFNFYLIFSSILVVCWIILRKFLGSKMGFSLFLNLLLILLLLGFIVGGKLPASQANAEVVSAFPREE